MMLDAHFGSIDTCTLLSPRALSLMFAVCGVCGLGEDERTHEVVYISI